MKKIILLLLFIVNAKDKTEITNFMQEYIDSLSTSSFIKMDESFKGQIENDKQVFKICRTQKCQVQVLNKTRTFKEANKITYYTFISVKYRNGTIRPDGCFVVYTNDSKQLQLSAYDHHCDED